MKLHLGFDPDLSRPSAAAVDEAGRVVAVWCGRTPDGPKDRKVERAIETVENWPVALLGGDFVLAASAAVEDQEVSYTARTGASPTSIIPLAQVAGAAFAGCGLPTGPAVMVKPGQWKGQVPKGIHQARICTRLGWPYRLAGGKEPYAVPDAPVVRSVPGADALNDGDWKHVLDAVGLALWSRDQWEQGQVMRRAA